MNPRISEVVELTRDLVSIKSSSLEDGEKEVAKYIRDYLSDLKIDSEIIEYQKGRCDIVASVGKGDGLMLNGHMDTVPIGDSSRWKMGTEPLVKNGKVYGRGTSDMKGGIAAILASLKGMDLSKPKRRLVLAFVADEEVALNGSKFLIEKRRSLLKGVRYGIIAEPTNLRIQIAQKGAMHIQVEIFGKSAHGSQPWEGESAILKGAELIVGLEDLASNFRKKDKLMGRGTINVGKIGGGTVTNVVPERCSVSIDRRIVPGESIAEAELQIKRILGSIKAKYKMEVRFAHGPYKLDKSSQIVKLVQSSSKAPRLTWTTGYTEAELYHSGAGIRSVVFGPGRMEVIHKPDEFVEVENLKKATAVFGKVLQKWV
ncbi:MAG: M20 family metallopeptidase [Candidatus Micrarchaeota archaeon]|nr:M20 family metallopeptidase [Candidatus Micrarchaeota archaeon]